MEAVPLLAREHRRFEADSAKGVLEAHRFRLAFDSFDDVI